MRRVAEAAFVIVREFGEYELINASRPLHKKTKKPESFQHIKNERLFILTAGHPRIFQIPSSAARMAIGGPQLSTFKDLVNDALRSDFVKNPPASYDDYFPRFLNWLETLPEHPRNKNAK